MGQDFYLIIFGIIQALVLAVAVFFVIYKKRLVIQNLNSDLKHCIEKNNVTYQKVSSLMKEMVPFSDLKDKVITLNKIKEDIKQKTGKISIAEAEKEAVNNRLKELEEISKELEASALETKKELDLLEAKQRELKNKNEQLNMKIQDNEVEIERSITVLEIGEDLQEKINEVKKHLTATQEQTKTLTMQLEGEKNQYLILKRRFDALDIEYAQLYEKYSVK